MARLVFHLAQTSSLPSQPSSSVSADISVPADISGSPPFVSAYQTLYLSTSTSAQLVPLPLQSQKPAIILFKLHQPHLQQ